MLEEVLAEYLITNLGGIVYPQYLPEGVRYPAITYRMSGGEEFQSLDTVEPIALTSLDIQIFSRRYQEVSDTSESVRNLLQGFKLTLDGVELVAKLVGERDGFNPPSDASDDSIYWIIQTYDFLHGEN